MTSVTTLTAVQQKYASCIHPASLSTVGKLNLEGSSIDDLIWLFIHCRAALRDGLGCSGPSPIQFQISQRMGIPQLLWATSSCYLPVSLWKVFSMYPVGLCFVAVKGVASSVVHLREILWHLLPLDSEKAWRNHHMLNDYSTYRYLLSD